MNENQNFSSEQEKEQQAEHFFVQKGIAVESAPRVRRVGSFTMGIALIVCGIVAILGLFRTDFDLILIAKFAPIVLILLGLEILVSSILFKRDKLKYDILSGFFCFLLICGSVGACMVLPLYEQFGPERYTMGKMVSASIDDLCYQTLKGNPDILDVQSEVWLDKLPKETQITCYNLRASDQANLQIELRGDFASPEEFAQSCSSVLKKVMALGVSFDQIDFSFSPKMEEGQNIGYDLCLNSRFQQNLDSATLSELVQTRRFENDSL